MDGLGLDGDRCIRVIPRQEQYDLRRYPDSQINIVKIDGKDALVYREFQSKTRQGGYLIGAKIQQGCLIVFVRGKVQMLG